jgi:hypothetical protein
MSTHHVRVRVYVHVQICVHDRFCMFMQIVHLPCSCSVYVGNLQDLQHGYATQTWSMDTQHRHAARTFSMHMQTRHGHIDIGYYWTRELKGQSSEIFRVLFVWVDRSTVGHKGTAAGFQIFQWLL